MIDRREILDTATRLSLNPHIVEKDFVLGWILAGINAHDALAQSWIFKGGTCLKKCFFETYRFSEDLDFTLTDPAHLDESVPEAGLRRDRRVGLRSLRRRVAGGNAGLRDLRESRAAIFPARAS